ncbi:hypothetical protein [Flindersiella endophytica]
MGNNYDSMASGLSSGKALGETAFYTCLVACTVWPELLQPIPAAKSGMLMKQIESMAGKIPRAKNTMNLPGGSYLGGLSGHASFQDIATSVPIRLRLIVTDTGQMLRACSEIDQSAEEGRRYVEALNHHYYSISPDVWNQNDQKAYSERLRKDRDAAVNTACLAEEAAMMTAIIATLRFAQHAISAALCGVLAAGAAAFWVAMCIPFGQGVAASIRSALTPVANMLPRIIQIMDEAMTMAGLAHASLLGVRTLQAGISDEIRLDDGGGLKDLLGAGGDTIGDIADKYLDKIKIWEKI